MTQPVRDLEPLRRALPLGAISSAPADLLAVSMDLWPRHVLRLWQGRTPGLPLAVVWPTSSTDVQRVIAFAKERGIPLVPYGAGSSVVGGASAGPGEIVVDMKRMARVLALDPSARTATAEAGILGELFERVLERAGFTQGHFPSSMYCSTLGGWIAARGAGQMSSRYGKIEDQVLGGAVVLGDGTLVRQTPSPVRSRSFEALVGSEGTLGVWTEATVRIHPLPAARIFRGLDFPDMAAALAAAAAWLRAGLTPAVVRIYDPIDTLLHRDTSAHAAPQDRGPSRTAWVGAHFPRLLGGLADRLSRRCRAIIGLQGDAGAVARDLAVVLDMARAHGAVDLGAGPGEDWWRTRYRVSYRQSNAFRAGVAVDTMEVACVWDRVPPVYEAVRRAGRAAGAQVLAHFSHVYLEGVSIYFTYAIPAELGEAAYDRLWETCLATAIEHGGNVSHHHGIGRLKNAALERALGGAVALVRSQAAALDPGGILNPAVLTARRGPTTPTSSAATAPSRRAQAPEEGFLVAAAPLEPLGALEASLVSRGLTLGPPAVLFADRTLLTAARAGWLWRKNPQLRVLESLVTGLDGRLDGREYAHIPAPRAAMGSELWPALLVSEVDRVWLRCLPRPQCGLRATGEASTLLVALREFVRDEETGALEVTLAVAGERGLLSVHAGAGPVSAARLQRAQARLRAAGFPCDEHTGIAEVERRSLRGEPVFFAALWPSVERIVTAAVALGAEVLLPWADPAGGAGFVTGPAGSALAPELRAEITALIESLDARPSEAAADAPAAEGAPRATDDAREPMPPSRRFLLLGLGNQLDNCTYCPKLCRFSCPVAVADGSETLTPRQLMLTANLDRRGVRRISADEAFRLYSCVDCRGCRSFCDHDNDVAEVLMQTRAELFAHGAAPSPVQRVLAALASAGRLPDSPEPSIADAVRGDGPAAATWVFFGCQNGGDDRGPAEAALELARQRFGSVHVVAGALRCCGHPLWRWGDRDGFARHARAFAAQLGSALRLVVDDPGCAYALRELYPRVGVYVPEIVTATSLLAERGVALEHPTMYAPHDDAWATRYLGEPSLRELVGGRLAAGSVLEGEAGSCGGMLLPYYDPTLAGRVARTCAHDLMGGGAQRILTASPTCRRRLRAVGAPVDDLLELWLQKRARAPNVGST